MSKVYFKKVIILFISFIMLIGIFPNFSASAATDVTDVSNLFPVDSTYSLIKSLEGCDLNCFWDVKQWTIGYGNKCPYTHNSNGTYWHQPGGHSISESEARNLFSSKLSGYVNILKSNCSGLSMNQNQFDALLSATYNHGNVNNCPLKYYLQGKLTKSEAREQYYVWHINPGTKDEKGLRNRRKKEADLFFTDPPPPPDPTGEYFPKCSSGYSSLVEALNSIGVDSSKANRKRIAEANGISNYSYSAEQNTYMLNLLKEGMLINPDVSPTPPVEPEKKWYESLSPVDIGSDFYAYIINVEPWLHLKNNNGNVETASPLREKTQFWKFTRNSDGSYKIVSCADGNCLDVYGAYSDSGTNIQTYPAHDDTSAQKWFIYGESGNYVFRPACSDCVLDVMNASSNAGANIQLYTKNDSSAQKFQIWKEMAELSVTPGDKANKTAFDWSDFLGDGIDYSLRIWKGTLWEGDSFKDVWKIKDRTDCEVELPVGHYEAYVDVCIGTEVQMTNVVKFDITEDYFGKSELNFVSGDKYNKTHFEWTPVEKAEFYDLKIWNGIVWEGDAYQIEWNIKDTSIDLALPDGYYEAYVDARNSNNMQMSNVIKFTIKEECVLLDGDANLDGEVTVADAVMLQKWLLGASDELTCWQNVDLYKDSRIDVFDLCVLKHMLVKNQIGG